MSCFTAGAFVWEFTDGAAGGQRGAQSGDFVVLGRESRYGLDSERGQFGVALFLDGHTVVETLDLLFQTLDLSFAWVGDHPGGAQMVSALFSIPP
ncbi:hypothetical protein IU470_00785 [Nocardia abscessus]|uniref:Uncharacterized protein n=1 Tax=Nocardia abscessus TaxID=120957 RepID=A0ABS0C4Z1_9NOCA|nr:hypothetical protein [Nocardia abscessus]MBF6223664.1 hypothetical protein [Nocardia abscessus]